VNRRTSPFSLKKGGNFTMAKARPCKKETKKELAKNKTVATL
jgi:hypothetical protein